MNSTNLPFDFAHIVNRAKLVFTQPDTCWDAIVAENKPAKDIIIGYVLPFAVLGAISYFISMGILGIHTPLGTIRMPIISTFVSAVITCIFTPVSVLAFGWIASMLAPKFGGTSHFDRGVALAAYSMTPAFIGSILMIVPIVGMIASLIGLYGVYIFYRGASKMLGVPSEKQILFTVVTLVASSLVMFILTLISLPFRPALAIP